MRFKHEMLRELRLRSISKTAQWVADELKVSKTTVSNWETGKHVPTPFYVEQLAKLYGVKISALWTDEDNKPKKKRRQQKHSR